MKNSQEEPKTSFDEYEDLTLFADESFDTGSVDLFEFSSEEDSPLTRLKSIILSLDWEISDDILQELTDEVETLQQEWQDDKVAEVYLQGLGKIGQYIRTKGAYAHPNAIKLLLTFYYDFEKIVSSDEISQEDIVLLLKGDVRKFKILQYQINKKEGIESVTEKERPQSKDPLILLKATILSLDWEVTDDNLEQFNQHLDNLASQLGEDKAALVLTQGLKAIGDYIGESKSSAHPESFTLLHSFSEALEQVIGVAQPERDKEQIQNLLTDRIGKLNVLKNLIAGGPEEQEIPVKEAEEQILEEIFQAPSDHPPKEEEVLELEEELPMDLEGELDELFPPLPTQAMESADVQYPDEVIPEDAIQPIESEITDDFIETEVSTKRGLTPALSDADDFIGFDEDAEQVDIPAQDDLNAQLDKLFESEEEQEAGEEDVLSSVTESEPLTEALADFEVPEDTLDTEIKIDSDASIDIESKLDNFFGEEDLVTDETQFQALSEVEEEEEDSLSPALVDSMDDQGFSIEDSLEELNESPLGDIEEKLDFFFDEEAEAAGFIGDEKEALATTIDEDLEADDFFPSTAAPEEVVPVTEVTEPGEDKNITLAELGAVLPDTIRSPNNDNIEQVISLLGEFNDKEISTEEKVLVQLLCGIVGQFSHSRFINLSATEKLVNLVYETLHKAESSPPDLPLAMENFIEWQLDVVAKMAESQAADTKPTAETKESEIAAGKIDMDHLRSLIQSEFTQLRNELKKE